MREQLNVRIPTITQDQVEDLCTRLGLTRTQLVIMAIDRMAREMVGWKPGDAGELLSKPAVDESDAADQREGGGSG
ncbi:MAG: hypothetical protein GX620_03235 [Chloroflexi bacterium]|nr:hypothetical protein [Chloroflexota bacterium]